MLIRRCWRLRPGPPTSVHLFPAQQQQWYGPWIAICGASVPFELRDNAPPVATVKTAELITNPGPGLDTRPCKRCAKIAAQREERHADQG